MPRTADLRLLLDRELARHRAACAAVERETAVLAEAEARVAHAGEALEHLQSLAQEVQQTAHRDIGRVATRCLTAVFGPDRRLKINFVQKRGKTEAEFRFFKSGFEVSPGVDSGGVMDITSMALRLASLALSQPQAAKFICLDEPVKMVDRNNIKKFAELLVGLSKELNLQMLLVTHNPNLEIGNVIDLNEE